MAEPIWTNLGSFESWNMATDQVWMDHGGDFRLRRYNRKCEFKADPSWTHICFSEIAQPIWTVLGSFESYIVVIYKVQMYHGADFRFRKYDWKSDLYAYPSRRKEPLEPSLFEW